MTTDGDEAQGGGARRKRRRSRGWFGRHRGEPTGTIEELAAQLAPLEEQTAARGKRAGANNNGGAIVVDERSVKLPEGLADGKGEARLVLGFEPVVLVILAFAAAFIIFVAWQISQMKLPTD
ncbi:MAG: hypothetical protein LC746_07060 [Acidobacteria bacterium]|nr:hypothetical protein [Acidobacteriota bacterium]